MFFLIQCLSERAQRCRVNDRSPGRYASSVKPRFCQHFQLCIRLNLNTFVYLYSIIQCAQSAVYKLQYVFNPSHESITPSGDLHSLNLTFVIPMYIYNLAINTSCKELVPVGYIYFVETFGSGGILFYSNVTWDLQVAF